MPIAPSKIHLEPTLPACLLRDIITSVEQLIVRHQDRGCQGRLPTASSPAAVPDYSQCLVVLNELACRSRSPNKYPIPLKSQEDLYHRLLSVEIEARYLYEEIESKHHRTNPKSSKQRSIEQLHTLRITYRNRWLLELERMLADCDRYRVASEKRKTQDQQEAAL